MDIYQANLISNLIKFSGGMNPNRFGFDFFPSSLGSEFGFGLKARVRMGSGFTELSELEPCIIMKKGKLKNTNFKGIGQPLRIMLTGSKFGPGIYDIILSLGKNEVIKRLGNIG